MSHIFINMEIPSLNICASKSVFAGLFLDIRNYHVVYLSCISRLRDMNIFYVLIYPQDMEDYGSPQFSLFCNSQ